MANNMIPRLPRTRTLVRPSSRTVSEGGIIFPNQIQGVAALEGTIIAVGPDCTLAKVGDLISFAPYSKYVVPTDEGMYRNHLLINEEDILLFWEKPKPKTKAAKRRIKKVIEEKEKKKNG